MSSAYDYKTGREWSEIAVLEVRGQLFEDWETVFVQVRWGESYPIFRFTAAERDPVPNLEPGKDVTTIWDKLQFRPGDSCVITLGGQLALTGFIETRQVAYDADNHGVMLIGKGKQAWSNKSSVFHETNNFDGKNLVQVAEEVYQAYDQPVKVIPTIDMTPFKRLQAEQGEITWDFIEKACRHRGVCLGTDELGNILLIGDHSFPISQQLIEGENILKMNCTITQQYKYEVYDVKNQGAADSEDNGSKQAQQKATAPGTATVKSRLITVCEVPVWGQGECVMRAAHEAKWHESTFIEATVTVQGWLRDGKTLWKAGDEVLVTSPMALLNNQQLKIAQATFTQDSNSGTLTTLELVNPGRLNGKPIFALTDVSSAVYGTFKGGAKNVSTENPNPPAGPEDKPAPEADVSIGDVEIK
jgi:prophage tail gpP-like protein